MMALAVEGLSVRYGKRAVIECLSVAAIEAGQVTALLGPNGSGKSTLLKALAGLARAGGQVLLGGRDLLKASFAERAEQVVYLPQSLPASVHLRVFESLLVARRASGGRQADEEGNAWRLLQRLGIEHLGMRFLDELSGGQKQLVGLAQALIRQPRVLLLDEPLSALDLNYQFHVMALIAEETRERGMITLIVLHDINISLRHTDRVLMLKNGALVANGAPAEVITAQSLAQVYGVRGRVERCSQGHAQVMIDGLVVGV
ncbi:MULTISPECIES: ABC transporter ATP-binding protein [unclassified Pseudomonas]|uniref:ABC transporter ATP-binding protein n=1 Tax=unclassified Pseudomonas TaxID=196821 RepID=UPI000BC7CF54|nr:MULTISPECIES: ABC transporter ATP-binding protein [unclassified Pseudomonas]PVZ20601.1 iron complex transport system ATP-binding protein [Pseudomonas sp. URIL14HWK12:I12]PVZ27667.1 iron complex transport system ATP-binding protein [Pseudomonas sp. URIL14HWK12:I10]PVZ38556.1 iron complex transport system ATP-binding protein [Pseudomonas sp. URIL14HWK12:I11]SNZ02889.1 iron complex transport system ATP-binding protein [Pseudomonas sp. URIL14HWK12:I9]